jgi:hypothetical protein
MGVKDELKKLIEEKFAQDGITNINERKRILSEVFDELSKPTETPSLIPKVASALYMERPDKSQTAEEFTHIHYGEYFDKGLTRADIKRLDKSLYGMLMKGRFSDSLKDLIPSSQGKGGGGRKPKMDLTKEERQERIKKQRRQASQRYRARQKQLKTL